MPSYIELDKQPSLPASSNDGKMIFGVNTSNEPILTDSSGNTFNFGTGSTTVYAGFLPSSGGTVSGDTIFESGLTATTLYATNHLSAIYEVDLSIGNFEMTGTGIYRISRGDNGASNLLSFPDPSLFIGGSIILINNDTTGNENAYFGGSFLPYSLGGNTQPSRVGFDTISIFYSINNEWRGGYLSAV